MNNKDLELEIEVLKKRISKLERKENRRTFVKVVKLIFWLALIGTLVFGAWWVKNEFPNYIKNVVKDTVTNSVSDGKKWIDDLIKGNKDKEEEEKEKEESESFLDKAKKKAKEIINKEGNNDGE